MRSRINLQGVFDGVMDAKVHRKMCIDAQFFVQRRTFLSAKRGKGIKKEIGKRIEDRGKSKGNRIVNSK